MRILLLHVYSPSASYDEMLACQRQQTIQDARVTRYFVRFGTPDQAAAVEWDAPDMICVRGEESGILGITQKTVEAIRYFLVTQEQWFDFVVRSNISTVIHHRNLATCLATSCPTHDCYTGDFVFQLQWPNFFGGVYDPATKDMWYAQGTCIVLSGDQAMRLVQLRHLLRYDTVDDIAFAIFMRDHSPPAYAMLGQPALRCFFPHGSIHTDELVQEADRVCTIRLKAQEHDRHVDIVHMRLIIESFNNSPATTSG